MWPTIAGSIGSAVTGAVVTEVIEMRRRRTSSARAELHQLRDDVTAAREQALLASSQLEALNQRVSDVLDRLNREAQ